MCTLFDGTCSMFRFDVRYPEVPVVRLAPGSDAAQSERGKEKL
jgi:hypothetical protein